MMRRLLAGIGGVGLAVVFSQFPEYAQQYTQRLGGAVDELRIVTEDFDRVAAAAGLERAEALARYRAAGDVFLSERGQGMERVFVRYGHLRQTLAQVEGARGLERLRALPAYLDEEIGRRTLAHYQPAVPFTLEGLLYAGAGFVLGYGLCAPLISLCALPFSRRRKYTYRRS